MKNTIFFIALFAALVNFGCKKCEEQPTASTCDRIEGVWKESFAPHAIFSFTDGLCTQRINFGPGGIYVLEYGYSCVGDTLTLIEVQTETVHKWVVSFTNDTTMVFEKENLYSTLTRLQ